MKSLLKKIVAGPKHKTPYQGGELDLTYITDRIIAMAYPASSFFEKTYRNSIDDVAGYFKEYHKNSYLIINVSSRTYDYSKLDNRVLEYEWPDHQAPPITTLFDIAAKGYLYLKGVDNGVVAVHCNHGKGRTGTAIISILLYLGCYKTTEQALQFYNSQRFSQDSYGVDQPCQLRYLTFVQKLLYMKKIPNKLIAYRLANVTHSGLHDKHYVRIKHVRSGKTLIEKFNFLQISQVSDSPLLGDLFIQVFQETWPSHKQLSRINYNTFFILPEGKLSVKGLQKNHIKLVLQGKEIKCCKSQSCRNFSITLIFQYFCLCHVEGADNFDCKCQEYRINQERLWGKMIKQIEDAHMKAWNEEDRKYFLCQQNASENIRPRDTDKLKQIQQEPQEQMIHHEIFPLSKNLSNIRSSKNQVIGVIKDTPQCKLKEANESVQEFEQGISPIMRQRRTHQFTPEDFKKCECQISHN